MAIKSTIFKLNLNVADINRQYYQDFSHTIARHASETDVRMFARITAFALNAHEHLQFTKGLSSDEEPDLWQVNLRGEIDHWIDLGQPLEKRIRQSCSKAENVTIYTYQRHNTERWYEGIRPDVERFKHLKIVHLNIMDESMIEKLIDRTMTLTCSIVDDLVTMSNDSDLLTIKMLTLKSPR